MILTAKCLGERERERREGGRGREEGGRKGERGGRKEGGERWDVWNEREEEGGRGNKLSRITSSEAKR